MATQELKCFMLMQSKIWKISEELSGSYIITTNKLLIVLEVGYFAFGPSNLHFADCAKISTSIGTTYQERSLLVRCYQKWVCITSLWITNTFNIDFQRGIVNFVQGLGCLSRDTLFLTWIQLRHRRGMHLHVFWGCIIIIRKSNTLILL